MPFVPALLHSSPVKPRVAAEDHKLGNAGEAGGRDEKLEMTHPDEEERNRKKEWDKITVQVKNKHTMKRNFCCVWQSKTLRSAILTTWAVIALCKRSLASGSAS